ncbi:MAG TPA: hypothetical protein VEN82_01965 [Actinomycetota bacterium]|nr:hypothetical protein [Actinomycetota bacterium]
MRRIMIVLAASLAVVIPAAAFAAGRSSVGGGLDRQAVGWQRALVTQPATPDWTDVPKLGHVNVCASGPVTVLANVVNGAAATDYRVRVDRTQTLQPGFVLIGQNQQAVLQDEGVVLDGLHRIDLQWYFWNGNPDADKTYRLGSFTVLYQQGTTC